MEHLVSQLDRLSLIVNDTTNFEYIGDYHTKSGTHVPNPQQREAHERVVFNSMKRYFNDHELVNIIHGHKRTEVDTDSQYADFLTGDIPEFQLPEDEHTIIGLNAMLDAFRPPKRCRPAHILDVKDKYPYKWHVNSEPPFSTDEYFLNNRKTFGEFYNVQTQRFDKYVDEEDARRRYASTPIENLLSEPTPAMFGFQKSTIFAWTRRWHHIIKSGFTDLSGLESTAYLRDRFIFPMLMHTKTTVVKADAPNKLRTIWGCSKPWIIADTMFFWEYSAHAKLNHGSTPMLWSFETITGGWFRLNAALADRLLLSSYVTLDWSRFDKFARFPLIRKIMTAVKHQFLDFEHGYVPTYQYPDTRHQWDDHQTQRINNLFEWTLENLFHAPIVMPDGKMYKRKHAGIPSGLYITQLLDSWYNYAMIATILSALGFIPNRCTIKVQGDDSVIRLNVLIPPSTHQLFLCRIEELASHYFDAALSLNKSEMSNTLNGVEVLSYTNRNGIPHRDEIKMMALFYHTKSRNPQPEITMAQAIGFAYASCGHHARVYLALENLYTHYYNQGYSANRAGLSLVFGNSPDLTMEHIDVDHFPSISEIQQFFLYTEYRNVNQENKTWPLDYFTLPPCIRDDD